MKRQEHHRGGQERQHEQQAPGPARQVTHGKTRYGIAVHQRAVEIEHGDGTLRRHSSLLGTGFALSLAAFGSSFASGSSSSSSSSSSPAAWAPSPAGPCLSAFSCRRGSSAEFSGATLPRSASSSPRFIRAIAAN